MPLFDPTAFRREFSCFSSSDMLGIYLDNAATTQLPDEVVQTLVSYYQQGRSNVHRSSSLLANQVTIAFEQARTTVAAWLGADTEQLIWTSGSTDGLNRIASGLTGQFQENQAIIVSALEHHANLIPWQQVCQQNNLQLLIIPTTEAGDLDLTQFEYLLNTHSVALVACCHVANSLGTHNNVALISKLSHQYGALCVIDGAQAVAHLDVDIKQLDCDAYVFSGHKMYAPTGIGALIGRIDFLERLTPTRFGGEMVREVGYYNASYRELPYRLEPGTPNIDGALALAQAVTFIRRWHAGRHDYEQNLLNYTIAQLAAIDGVKLVATPLQQCAVIAFEVIDVHPFDITSWLNEQQIAIRCGYHCAMPITKALTRYGSIRVSLASYNTQSDIDLFIQTLQQAIDINRL
ncbi:aminotransferase class V-fold PLP-dependent enzyme [Celerinatantimonas yamalensis]|uniref:cysteine desulfurase n=1 Tax=Celerinatantimonas yamalensis TaxID=559956 RepID=A0ABW9G3G0_9GAMM